MVFFIALALTILLNTIDEQHKEIKTLRFRKKQPTDVAHKQSTDQRSYDPLYISDRFNPNHQKLQDQKEEKIEIDVFFFRGKNPYQKLKELKDGQQKNEPHKN